MIVLLEALAVWFAAAVIAGLVIGRAARDDTPSRWIS